jgi:hypothetical protein
MKSKPTPLVDEHLQSLQGMQEAETGPFFYTRLRARMEKPEARGWSFPLKPAWLVASLVMLLAINSWMLVKSRSSEPKPAVASTLQQFAASYDMTISSY